MEKEQGLRVTELKACQKSSTLMGAVCGLPRPTTDPKSCLLSSLPSLGSAQAQLPQVPRGWLVQGDDRGHHPGSSELRALVPIPKSGQEKTCGLLRAHKWAGA